MRGLAESAGESKAVEEIMDIRVGREDCDAVTGLYASVDKCVREVLDALRPVGLSEGMHMYTLQTNYQMAKV